MLQGMLIRDSVQRRKELTDRFPDWRGWSLAEFFDQTAGRYPDRPAIVLPGRTWSYREILERSRYLAGGLVAMGARPGDRIAIMLPNLPEFVEIKLAIARAGCIAVPVNFLLRRDELAYVVEQSGCRILIGTADFRGRDYVCDLTFVREAVDSLQSIILVQGQAPDCLTLEAAASLGRLADLPTIVRQTREISPGAVSDIIFTSGTTGKPKGATLTHDMVLRAAYSSALTRSFEDGRRIQFALPMYHVFGYVECWVASLFVGGAIVPHSSFDPREMLAWCEELGTSDLVCVPLMTRALIEEARLRGFNPSTLLAVFNSGGVNSPGIWQEIRSILGVREIHTAYGMTETTASAMCTSTEDCEERLQTTNGGYKIAGAAGDPAIGGRVAEYRVVDPASDMVLSAGEVGELQVRGPIVTRGYFGKPEEDALAFTPDGWFRTGDLGQLLDDGYLKLTGRLKESYRCGGEMVAPREIEDLFEAYPGIAQVLAVGVPDRRMGEVGCLCVVASDDCKVDEQALIAHCSARLAKFKVPKYVLMISAKDLPLTATGRPQKFMLTQLATERLGLQAKP